MDGALPFARFGTMLPACSAPTPKNGSTCGRTFPHRLQRAEDAFRCRRRWVKIGMEINPMTTIRGGGFSWPGRFALAVLLSAVVCAAQNPDFHGAPASAR